MNKELRERYFTLKGKFLELKDKMIEKKHDSMTLAIASNESLAAIYFDDFKLTFYEKLQEIDLILYLNSQMVGSLNIAESNKNFQFDFYFDEVNVDFITVEEKKAC
ncbi:hypothetical protein CLTEP_25030 [Clostridium tepidiprofundi DSM 19306]|uniref:Uncharacterized protein n=1 Tax=Clostridium tepidiprofundi DSM 19306 TaxID=1121338 RepID=A0A151ATL4_9CLOT|nr:hypothetical protein [Clostridium tepidiprofundi]KYH30737.1 hypothetical protein CLTEP_25030 [Clostridium tepidiprofundi DSM 19306]